MKTKLAVLLVTLLAMGGSLFGQGEGTPVRLLTGSGAPGGSVAHTVGTQYIDISAATPALYVCSSISVAGNGTVTCNWTATSGGGISTVPVLPPTCAAGAQFQLPNGQVFTCGAGNTYRDTSAAVGAISPTSFGAKFDGKGCFGNANTIVVTLSSNIVTCNVGNFCNGTTVACAAGQTSDVGKQFTWTNGCCGVQNQYAGVLLGANVSTTITGVTNSTTITVSQNATVGCTGVTCLIAWATNDDTAITNAETAWAAGNKCGAFVLPAGITAILQPHWNSPGAVCVGVEPQANYAASIYGQGIGASIVGLFPGFNSAGCTSTHSACFFDFVETTAHDMQFNGFGWGNTGFGSAKTLVFVGLGGQVSQIACNAFGGSDTNLTGLSNGLGGRFWGISWDGCGSIGWNIQSGITKAYYCFIGDTLGLNVNITSSGDLTDFGCDYGVTGGTAIMSQAGRYHGVGSNLFGCSNSANATAINMGNLSNTSITILDGARWNCTSTTSNGIFMNSAGQKTYIVGGTHVGGTTAAINRSAGTVYIDPTATFDAGAITSLAPTCVMTTGGGTGPACAAVAGSTNEKGTIRMTPGTTPGATGTTTITMAGTFAGPSNSTPNCNFSYANTGTGAWSLVNTTPIIMTTRSTTVPVFNWNETSALTAASTYDVDYVCVAR